MFGFILNFRGNIIPGGPKLCCKPEAIEGHSPQQTPPISSMYSYYFYHPNVTAYFPTEISQFTKSCINMCKKHVKLSESIRKVIKMNQYFLSHWKVCSNKLDFMLITSCQFLALSEPPPVEILDLSKKLYSIRQWLWFIFV